MVQKDEECYGQEAPKLALQLTLKEPWLTLAIRAKTAEFLVDTSATYLALHTGLLPRWLSGSESACDVRDAGSIPGSGRFSGEGNGDPLQYSCLENSVAGHSPWGQDLATKQQQRLDQANLVIKNCKIMGLSEKA